jgi:hypothetical protein
VHDQPTPARDDSPTDQEAPARCPPRPAPATPTVPAQAPAPAAERATTPPADDPEKPTVIILAQDFRLSEVLRHIEAGRIVLVIPADTTPP